jgi:uncharacterized membrane protein
MHGRKNRNVILAMLFIWAVAVFGFQFLLRGIEKPTPEKALLMFDSVWPGALKGTAAPDELKTLLKSLVLVKGKNMVKPGDQDVLSQAISCVMYGTLTDSIKAVVVSRVADNKLLKSKLPLAKDEEYLNIKTAISANSATIISVTEPFTGFAKASLEAGILAGSLDVKYPLLLSDNSFTVLPGIMKLYLTHNQSVLTDTKFLGFPFHYFYTAVFLLIMFIVLCIVYNILIEWRLKKQGVVE